jgi:hypothetical protein
LHRNAIAASEFLLFLLKERDEGLTNVPEAYQAEIEGPDVASPFSSRCFPYLL